MIALFDLGQIYLGWDKELDITRITNNIKTITNTDALLSFYELPEDNNSELNCSELIEHKKGIFK